MKNNEIYQNLNENEGLKLPSYMGIIPRDKDFPFDMAKLKLSLENNKEFKLKSFEMRNGFEDEVVPVLNYSFDSVIVFRDVEYEARISAFKTEGHEYRNYSFANTVDEESLNIAVEQPYYLETRVIFADDPMESFLFQLKLLNTIVPNASLVLDLSSMRLLSPKWLSMAAASGTPPSPNYLYIIHAVYDDKGKDKFYWMHTHGLHRCGSMELELVNIKSGAEQMHNLINATANMFILDHKKENESFQIGYDGLGIHLCWLRWEEALKEFPKNVLGGIEDRTEEEDGEHNVHSEPSGILFAVEDGNLTSPEIFSKTLADNPIYFIKSEETARMSALAKENFHLFEKEFKTHYVPKEPKKKSFLGKLFGGEKDKNPEWRFLVKLGLMTDNATEESDKEHLWFEVLSIEGERITTLLLNQPYWVSGLNEGDENTYSIQEVLTDWIIYGPENQYTPDSIYMLN